MIAVRRLLLQRRVAMPLCMATLLLRLLVPTGYMIGSAHGRPVIELCSGVVSRSMAIEMSGMHGDMPDHGKSKDHGKAEMPCAFSGLATASLGAIDPIQLAALTAFVLHIAPRRTVPRSPVHRTHLRPPLRGPPATL